MRVGRVFLLGVALASTGCSAIRFGGGPPPVPLQGRWTGYVEIEGQEILGTLTISQKGSDLGATFVSTGLIGSASGQGKIDGEGRISIKLAYRTQCDGELTLSGMYVPYRESIEGDNPRLEGTATAKDCTGTARGRFRFTRF